MTQLIINGMELPEALSNNDGAYKAKPVLVSKKQRMISGLQVEEIQGYNTEISYEYPYLDDESYKALIKSLTSKNPISVAYLDSYSLSMKSGLFVCTELPDPDYLLSDIDDKVYWTGIAFKLESLRYQRTLEVSSSD